MAISRQRRKGRELINWKTKKLFLDAKDIKTYSPICTMAFWHNSLGESTKDIKTQFQLCRVMEASLNKVIIYFNYQVIVEDLDIGKQIWYEKARDREEYFIEKIIRTKYNNKSENIELYFRDRNFSDPNICMIKVNNGKDWDYYMADIDDTLFYRTIEFGDTETIDKDLQTNFEIYLYNIEKRGKNLISLGRIRYVGITLLHSPQVLPHDGAGADFLQ